MLRQLLLLFSHRRGMKDVLNCSVPAVSKLNVILYQPPSYTLGNIEAHGMPYISNMHCRPYIMSEWYKRAFKVVSALASTSICFLYESSIVGS